MQALIDELVVRMGGPIDRERLERIARCVAAAAPGLFSRATPDLVDDETRVEDVIAALENPQERSVEAAAQWLERRGVHAELMGVLERVSSDPRIGAGVRGAAARAIVRSRAPAIVNALLRSLWSEEKRVRLGGIRGLAIAREASAIRPLLRIVAHGDREEGALAMWAIGEIGEYDPWAERVLLDALRAGHCSEAAVEALGKLASPAALRDLLMLARRRHAVIALGACARIVDRYLGLMETDHAHKGHVALLLPQLRHAEQAVRALAAIVLLRLGHPLDRAALPL